MIPEPPGIDSRPFARTLSIVRALLKLAPTGWAVLKNMLKSTAQFENTGSRGTRTKCEDLRERAGRGRQRRVENVAVADHAVAEAIRSHGEFRWHAESAPDGCVDRRDRGVHGRRATHPREKVVHHAPLVVLRDDLLRFGEDVAGERRRDRGDPRPGCGTSASRDGAARR